MPLNFVNLNTLKKLLLFTFLLSYLFLEKSFLHISFCGWGWGTTTNSFLCNLFFRVEFGLLLSLTCCGVSLLSDQAMLTFVQIDLIKLKKNAFYLHGLHCLLLSLSLGMWGSKALLQPHFEGTWPGQR